jgi:glutathione peroxidase
MESIYDCKVETIEHETIDMSAYKDRVLLVVNTASKCGYTHQYEELQKLHQELNPKGLSVLGFPCNQFLNQEPNDEEAIMQFCSLNYNVSFDMFAKIEVNGENTHPLYKYLKSQQKGIMGSNAIKWNFTKFLVDKDGNVIERYAPSTNPSSIKEDILKLL